MKTVVKYGNRKLYDRETSKYITLSELIALPLGTFRVVKHGTNEDITTETLLSAISTGNFPVRSDLKIEVMQHCIQELS